MFFGQRTVSVLLAVALATALSACNTLGANPGLEASDEFPVPATLQPNVNFWRQVYAEWSRGQVAVHDDRYMGVIYEVARLPGPMAASYTAEQRDFVDRLKDGWQSRLKQLSARLARGESLSREEQAIKKQLVAAGGPAALRDPAERVRTQRGLRERFKQGLETSGAYDQRFREIFRRHGAPEDLAYLPHVESSFQLHARSSAGASGMWQFIRSTGRRYMVVNGQIDERLDPVISADAAARYLSQAHAQLGSWPLALTSYNHGVGGMRRARQVHGADIGVIVANYQGRYFGFASRNFYAEFIAARHVARHAAHYFPEGVRYAVAPPTRQIHLDTDLTVAELAKRYQQSGNQLLQDNPAWRDNIRDGRAPVPAGSRVWIRDTRTSPPLKPKSDRAPFLQSSGASPSRMTISWYPEIGRPDHESNQPPRAPREWRSNVDQI